METILTSQAVASAAKGISVKEAWERMAALDPAHGYAHVEAVRHAARKLARTHAPGLLQIVDEAARLHDIGLVVNREHHEVIGAWIVFNDPAMRVKWGRNLGVIVDAVLEHRASTGRPQSVVAKIVSDADRLGTPEGSNPLRRSMDYQIHHGKASTEEEALMLAAEHISKKYGPGGTGTRAYFPETATAITAARQPVIDALAAGDIERLAALAELPPRWVVEEHFGSGLQYATELETGTSWLLSSGQRVPVRKPELLHIVERRWKLQEPEVEGAMRQWQAYIDLRMEVGR